MRVLAFCCMIWLGLASSCGESVVHPDPDRGFDYFPLQVGSQWTYQTDSIVFDDGGSPNILDTLSGFVRERITDQVVDLEGDTVFQVERSFRRLEGTPWATTLIWTTSRDFYSAERTEENVRFVKLAFPIGDSTKWDPLLYISADTEVLVGTELIEMYTNWSGSILARNHPQTIGQLMFPDVITCIQADDNNEIERRYVREHYARGVGLVMRVDTILDSYCKRIGMTEPCLGLDWMEKGEKGYILRQQLIDYQ